MGRVVPPGPGPPRASLLTVDIVRNLGRSGECFWRCRTDIADVLRNMREPDRDPLRPKDRLSPSPWLLLPLCLWLLLARRDTIGECTGACVEPRTRRCATPWPPAPLPGSGPAPAPAAPSLVTLVACSLFSSLADERRRSGSGSVAGSALLPPVGRERAFFGGHVCFGCTDATNSRMRLRSPNARQLSTEDSSLSVTRNST